MSIDQVTSALKQRLIDLSGLGYCVRFDFGDDGVERHELLAAGLERARRIAGRAFRPEDVLLVGDTEHDVACAAVTGAQILAVATGNVLEADLRAAGADWVVPDLTRAVGHAALAPTGAWS